MKFDIYLKAELFTTGLLGRYLGKIVKFPASNGFVFMQAEDYNGCITPKHLTAINKAIETLNTLDAQMRHLSSFRELSGEEEKQDL